MEVRKCGDGPERKPPAPAAPTVTVLFGGEPGGPAVGVVSIEVPLGVAARAHAWRVRRHIVIPIVGTVTMSTANETITIDTGDAALVTKEEWVSLSNPGTNAAHLLVVAGLPHSSRGSGNGHSRSKTREDPARSRPGSPLHRPWVRSPQPPGPTVAKPTPDGAGDTPRGAAARGAGVD